MHISHVLTRLSGVIDDNLQQFSLVNSTSTPLGVSSHTDSGFGHVTSFSQWDICKHDISCLRRLYWDLPYQNAAHISETCDPQLAAHPRCWDTPVKTLDHPVPAELPDKWRQLHRRLGARPEQEVPVKISPICWPSAGWLLFSTSMFWVICYALIFNWYSCQMSHYVCN